MPGKRERGRGRGKGGLFSLVPVSSSGTDCDPSAVTAQQRTSAAVAQFDRAVWERVVSGFEQNADKLREETERLSLELTTKLFAEGGALNFLTTNQSVVDDFPGLDFFNGGDANLCLFPWKNLTKLNQMLSRGSDRVEESKYQLAMQLLTCGVALNNLDDHLRNTFPNDEKLPNNKILKEKFNRSIDLVLHRMDQSGWGLTHIKSLLSREFGNFYFPNEGEMYHIAILFVMRAMQLAPQVVTTELFESEVAPGQPGEPPTLFCHIVVAMRGYREQAAARAEMSLILEQAETLFPGNMVIKACRDSIDYAPTPAVSQVPSPVSSPRGVGGGAGPAGPTSAMAAAAAAAAARSVTAASAAASVGRSTATLMRPTHPSSTTGKRGRNGGVVDLTTTDGDDNDREPPAKRLRGG